MEYTIKSNEVCEEYLQELMSIIEIRKEKRLIYKDSFLTDEANSLLTIVKGKIKRYEISGNIDDLRDCANYLIFILCLINKEKNGTNTNI